MTKWINGILALLVYGAYVARHVHTHTTPSVTLGILGTIGFLIVMLADPVVNHFGPVTSMGTEPAEYGCIIKAVGWTFLLLPAVWLTIMYVLFSF